MNTISIPSHSQLSPAAVERQALAWLSLGIMVAVLAGFSRTYLLVPALGMPEGSPPYSTIIHVHGAVFFSWCGLYVLQSWLVPARRLDLHRRLGPVGFVLAGIQRLTNA